MPKLLVSAAIKNFRDNGGNAPMPVVYVVGIWENKREARIAERRLLVEAAVQVYKGGLVSVNSNIETPVEPSYFPVTFFTRINKYL